MIAILTRPFTNTLPVTRIKLSIAALLYRIVRCFIRSDHVVATRCGITYKLDLSEGIDLSVFIFGTFQSHIFRSRIYSIPDNAVILDIGANIGSMSLQFSQAMPKAQVFAFEPTEYGYNKLLANLRLNPELALKITPVKSFVSDRSRQIHSLSASSSWRINTCSRRRHPVHGGILKRSNAPCISIDDFCKANTINRLDLIKIDTEGYEFHVLKGAMQTIRNHKPVIIFETGFYIMDEFGIRFQDYMTFLNREGYRLFSLQHNHEITVDNAKTMIPRLSTIDIVAVPGDNQTGRTRWESIH